MALNLLETSGWIFGGNLKCLMSFGVFLDVHLFVVRKFDIRMLTFMDCISYFFDFLDFFLCNLFFSATLYYEYLLVDHNYIAIYKIISRLQVYFVLQFPIDTSIFLLCHLSVNVYLSVCIDVRLNFIYLVDLFWFVCRYLLGSWLKDSMMFEYQTLI